MVEGTYATTDIETIQVLYAQHIGIKIGTDLKRMQRFYNQPTDEMINEYEKEIITLLRGNYLQRVEYGFKTKNNRWSLAIRYEARQSGVMIKDDDPGSIPIGAEINECTFNSFLVYNKRWSDGLDYQRKKVYAEAGVSFERWLGDKPGGLWKETKGYSARGRGILRSDLMV